MKRQFYTEEMVQYIRDNVNLKSNIRIAEDMGLLFGRSFTPDQIHGAMNRYHIKRDNPKLGHDLRYQEMVNDAVPAEVAEFIRENHVGVGQKKMIEIIKQKFGIEYKHHYMKFYYRRMGYCSGLTGHFSADDPRVIEHWIKKGQHMSRKTEFKKGSKPHNALPVGSIVKQTEGFWAKKVAEPNVWKHLHRLIWEEANGPIPKDKVLIFLDGNLDHYQLENLAMVSRSESFILNMKGYRSNDADRTKLGLMSVKVSNKVKELKKDGRIKRKCD